MAGAEKRESCSIQLCLDAPAKTSARFQTKTSMTTETLYEAGWHQGSVLRVSIEAIGNVRAREQGKVARASQLHDLWMLVTQDCSLARTPITNNAATIELRQVHDTSPPIHWGIHSRKFLLDDASKHYLIDDKPTAFVSPRLLCDAELTELLYTLSDDRVLALKTWLGNRYDRPAVPPELVPLAKAVATSVGSESQREIGRIVREVYMQFDGERDNRTFSLFAVTMDDADPELVREWLVEGALEVPRELGVPREIEVGAAGQVSLRLVETAYCADLSQLTWDNESPDGAF